MQTADQSRERLIDSAVQSFAQRLRARLDEVGSLSADVQRLEQELNAKRDQLARIVNEIQVLAPELRLQSVEPAVDSTPGPSGSAPRSAPSAAAPAADSATLRTGLRVFVLEALEHYETTNPAAKTTVEGIRIYLNTQDSKILRRYASNSLRTALAFLKARGFITAEGHAKAPCYRMTDRGRSTLQAFRSQHNASPRDRRED